MTIEEKLPDSFTGSDGQKVAQPVLRKILKVVAEKKATYPSEVSWFVSLEPGEVGAILRQLEEAGVLERLNPRYHDNDERLLARKEELWNRGFRGMDAWRQMNWYGLNSDKNWFLKAEGENFHVDEYGREIGVDMPDDAISPTAMAERAISDE